MRGFILFLTLQSLVGSVAFCEDKKREDAIMKSSIGSILLAIERKGDDGAENAIMAEYPRIKKLSCAARVDFFWVLIMHLDIRGGPRLIFEEVMAKDDCRDQLIKRLEHYLAQLKGLSPSTDSAGQRFAGRREVLANHALEFLQVARLEEEAQKSSKQK